MTSIFIKVPVIKNNEERKKKQRFVKRKGPTKLSSLFLFK